MSYARQNLDTSEEPQQLLMWLLWGGRHEVLSRTSVPNVWLMAQVALQTSHVQDIDPIRLDMPLVVHNL